MTIPTSPPAPEVRDLGHQPSWIDRATLAALHLVPGARRNGLTKRVLLAVHGSAWTAIGYALSQLLRLATQLILARKLLGPQAFGLVALVSVFLSGLEMLSDLGVGTDVVQHPRGDDLDFINTAFLIQAGRGTILWVLSAALAYPFAAFYHQPAVRWMIFVAAISVGLRGFASGSVWTMTRHVQVGRLTALNVGGDFVGFLVSVGWALVSPTAWALVVGKVASTAVYMIGSHVVAEHPVSLKWDSAAARDILGFGTGVFLSSATYFMSGEVERLVIGKYITVSELGCFSLALTMSLVPCRGIQQVIVQVFFPMIAKAAREDRVAAVRDYKKARVPLLIVTVMLSCGFILFGPLIVRVLLGGKYADAGWILQLLGFRSALELSASSAQSLLFASGVSRYSSSSNVGRLLLMSTGLAVAFTKFGFRQAVWALAFAQFGAYLPLLWGLRIHFKPVLKTESVCLVIFLACSLVAAGVVRAGF